MPVRTSASAHQLPTPPTPKRITLFWEIRAVASSPNKRFTREKISVFKVLRGGKTKSQRDEETKRRRDEESKSQRSTVNGQRDKETKGQRVKESKRRRDKGTKSRRDKETKSQRDKETKGGRDKETKGKGQGTAWDFEFPRRLHDVNGGRKTPPKAVAVGGVS